MACAGDFGERVNVWLLGDGSGVWLGPGAVASPGPCGEGSTITFTQAEVLLGENRFVRVRGSITVEGLRITGGTYRPPDEWLKLAPGLESAILQGATFTVPSGIGVTAPFTATGGWRALGGEFRVPTGLELLDLPHGWKFQPALLRFETSGLISVELSAQSAAGPQGGQATIAGAFAPLGQLDIDATVSSLGVLRQSDGSQVTLDGGGSLSFTWKDDPNAASEDSGLSLVMDPEIFVEAQGSIRLMENFEIRALKLRWNPERISAAGTVRIGSEQQGNFMDLTLDGEYAGTDDWRFALTAKGAWKPGAGMTVTNLEGEVDLVGFEGLGAGRRLRQRAHRHLVDLAGAPALLEGLVGLLAHAVGQPFAADEAGQDGVHAHLRRQRCRNPRSPSAPFLMRCWHQTSRSQYGSRTLHGAQTPMQR